VPRNSISRRVARAASIGGSRSYRQRTPLGWYSILLLVCVIGLGLIVFSRHEREVASENATTTTTTTTQPPAVQPTTSAHWQVALSLDICGKVVNLPRSADQTAGIITSGNGVVDVQPARAGKDAKQYEGLNATLGKFLTAENVALTNKSLKLPSSLGKLAGTYTNGRLCSTKPGQLALDIWTSPSATAPYAAPADTATAYTNGQLWMLAFVPKGASVPKPPAAHLVTAFVKSQTTTTTTTTAPPKSGTTTTTKPGTVTTTTKPGTVTTTSGAGSTTTTSGSSTTTTAG
jgi:hypothetical protein